MTGYAIYEFPLGRLKIEYEESWVSSIRKVSSDCSIEPSGDCKESSIAMAGFDTDLLDKKTNLTNKVYLQIMEYMEGKRKTFDFPYKLVGTAFQKKVWNQLLQIPYGETRTYKDIAIAIGNPKASRAVGMANNKNPMNIVVPCHRVIGTSGKLVGYAGGLDMKETLLKIEDRYKSLSV